MRKLPFYFIALAMTFFVACGGGDGAASEGDVQEDEMMEESAEMEEAEEAPEAEEMEESEEMDEATEAEEAEMGKAKAVDEEGGEPAEPKVQDAEVEESKDAEG